MLEIILRMMLSICIYFLILMLFYSVPSQGPPGYFHFNPYFRKRRLSPLHDQQLVACPIDLDDLNFTSVSSEPDEDEIFMRSLEYFTDDTGDIVLTSPAETFMSEAEAKVLRRATKVILYVSLVLVQL